MIWSPFLAVILTQFLFIFVNSILYNDLYFDIKDRMKADCVRKNNFLDYNYLGDRDTVLNGQPCVAWKDVAESWLANATDDQKALLTTIETVHHSKCRTVKLNKNHPYYYISDSGSPPIKAVTSGAFGPWCFVLSDGFVGTQYVHFSPMQCFLPCNESKVIVPPMKRKHAEVGYSYMKLNYNKNLLDPIDKLFTKYSNGDERYYDYKPSRFRPPDFYALRQTVFFSLCFVFFVVIVWFLTCFWLKKRAARIHREREKSLQNFYDSTNLADIRMGVELQRESASA